MRLAIKLLHQLAIVIAEYNIYIGLYTCTYTCIHIDATIPLRTIKFFYLYHISLVNVKLGSNYCRYFEVPTSQK